MPHTPLPGPARTERTVALALLAVLVVFYAVSSSAWGVVDQVCPMWDQARHAWDALRLRAFLAQVVRQPWRLGELMVWHDNYYVFLGYLPTALAHALFGPSFDVAQVVMAVFWTPLALVSSFWLVTQLLGPMPAFVSTAWLASSPLMADFAKDYLVDQPILALLALALALLVKSDYLHHPRWAMAFGVAAGCIVLVKAVAPAVFVVVPAALTGVVAWRRGTLPAWRRGAGYSLLGWFLVAGPVHVMWRGEFLQAVQWQQRAATVEGDPREFLPGALVHVDYLVNLQARGVMLPWLAWGAVRLWRTHRSLVLAGLACFLACELAWTLYPNKDVRFCYPDLLFVAALAGGVAWRLSSVTRQVVAGVAALVVALFSTWSIQWGVGFLPPAVQVAGVTLFAQHGYMRGKPDPSPSTPLAVITPIAQDHEWQRVTQGRRVGLLQYDFKHDEPHFNGWAIKHANWILGHLFEVEETPGIEDQMDFFLETSCQGAPWTVLPGFAEVTTMPTPGGCTARLQKNTRLRQQEALVRAAPPLGIRYQAEHMEQTLLSAWLGDGDVTPGQPVTATFLVRADANHKSRRMQRTLRLGQDGPVVATWVTGEPRWEPGSEYPFSVTFPVPASTPPGEHLLVLSGEGPRGPAVVLDRDSPHALSSTQIAVGRLRVTPPAGEGTP
jgi:hypothetical protein